MPFLSLNPDHFDAVNTHIEAVTTPDGSALRVYKANKQMIFDTNTYAVLNERDFHNGTLLCEMKSQLLPDAPDFARGFIGFIFRLAKDASAFESFYVRPTNGRGCEDPVRRGHGCQYFTYPRYTFAYYREHGITGFEAPVDVALGEWFPVKAVIQDAVADFYVRDMEHPVLHVSRMNLPADAMGRIGFYVDTGTDALFRNLEVSFDD